MGNINCHSIKVTVSIRAPTRQLRELLSAPLLLVMYADFCTFSAMSDFKIFFSVRGTVYIVFASSFLLTCAFVFIYLLVFAFHRRLAVGKSSSKVTELN
jgi:hypothetical protein